MEGEMMTRQEFIGNYLSKKMKDHGLPYGIAYINLLANHEEIADKKWIIKTLKKAS